MSCVSRVRWQGLVPAAELGRGGQKFLHCFPDFSCLAESCPTYTAPVLLHTSPAARDKEMILFQTSEPKKPKKKGLIYQPSRTETEVTLFESYL